MEKILAEISVPAIGKSYDVFLPKSITVAQAIRMLNQVFEGLNTEYFKDASEMFLCDKDNCLLYTSDAADEL